MKDSVDFGLNKTPTQLHPKNTAEMVEGYKEFPPKTIDNTMTAFDMRAQYARESGELGSVPLPATFKGMANVGMQALKGNSPSVLIDKLGERLAFERGGTRLYDALITKRKALHPEMSTAILETFRDQEHQHFLWLRDTITHLGGDPTAQTPCADASGVASMGLMQVMNDPRSTLPQCAEMVLNAELIDGVGWEMLIELVRNAGLEDIAQKFLRAKQEEDVHLITIRQWLERMTLENGAVPLQ